jgi:hypothetical protein
MADNIYLEIDKANGAILSYSNEQLQSSTSDFIEATEVELSYLSHLEDKVFAAGMVATLSDLQDYRVKVKALAQGEAKVIQLKAKLAQLKLQQAKAQVAAKAARADMDTFMAKAAADRGLTVPQLESALADFKARTESTSKTSDTKASTNNGKVKADALTITNFKSGFKPVRK